MVTVNQPILAKPAKLNLKSVVAAISPKGGIKDAVARDANGFVPRKIACPAQLMILATSIPRSTAAFTPFCARIMMTNSPINIVTTPNTIAV